jgi:hypothetical protein
MKRRDLFKTIAGAMSAPALPAKEPEPVVDFHSEPGPLTGKRVRMADEILEMDCWYRVRPGDTENADWARSCAAGEQDERTDPGWGLAISDVTVGATGTVGDYADFGCYSIKWDDTEEYRNAHSWLSGELIHDYCEFI